VKLGFPATKSLEGYLSFFFQQDAEKTLLTGKCKVSREQEIDTSLLFGSFKETQSDDYDDDDGSLALETDANSTRDHVLSVEDEFLRVMMKLRLGLTNVDLALIFDVAEATTDQIQLFHGKIYFFLIQLSTLKI